MSYDVNIHEFEAVTLLGATERYQYFINKVADWEEVWSVKNKDGWITMVDDEGNTLIPVWPAELFAVKSCTDDWNNCHAEPIALDDWMSKWLPGMTQDERLCAVFPLSLKGAVISPKRLKNDLDEALSQY